ncbi:hypothetical protein BD289DRAFT_484277 [Coniella lustricola]|uniref:Uncharacterized protein n=1 Tax=Coniella lustricola TaxID=2025994 RepID=A0A2T3A2I7_9PEZI|nr:hypothetical protein BD289DRAFT_484277 [Coniella lustricola]
MTPSAQPHDHRDGGSSAPSSASSSHLHSEAAGRASDPSPPPVTAPATRAPRSDQELAQAFRDLARGEQTAAALESNLTNLESKLDELLAAFEDMAGDPSAPVADDSRQGKHAGSKDKTDSAVDENN